MAWPISKSATPDTSFVVFPYGPRNIGRYDFHAGMDIYVPRGTPVGAVMAGSIIFADESKVQIQHADQRQTAYLHLDRVHVQKGDRVQAGDIIGNVGDTNAKNVHLHLTYMVSSKPKASETHSRNPLEILPHPPPRAPLAVFEKDLVRITLHAGTMTVRKITLVCGNGKRLAADYRVIVVQGSRKRDNQNQSGIRLSAGRPVHSKDGGRQFDLFLSTIDHTLSIQRVILEDFSGQVVLDSRR